MTTIAILVNDILLLLMAVESAVDMAVVLDSHLTSLAEIPMNERIVSKN